MKKILLVLVIIAIISTTLLAFVSCNSSTSISDKDYQEMEEYYTEALSSIKKCEPLIDSLMANFKKASFTSTFLYEHFYYSTAPTPEVFKGTPQVRGYNNNSKNDGTCWMAEPINYTIKQAGANNLVVEAKVYEPIKKNDYNKDKLPAPKATYKMTIKNDDINYEGGEAAVVKQYCYDKISGVISQLTNKEYLEKHVISAESGFRLYTSMMQYQTSAAYAASDLSIVNYKQNKGKIKPSAVTVTSEGNILDDKKIDMTADNVAYWDGIGADISYNFYKIKKVENKKVTMTYSKSKSRLDSFEYSYETVLPFYTKKDKFNDYSVIKATVADYSYFVMNIEYTK